MAVTTLISPTTATATSPAFTSSGKNNIGICCNALLTTETITLQILDRINNVWANAIYNSTTYQLTATSNFMTISEDAQTYRLVKSITANAVGVGTVSDLTLV